MARRGAGVKDSEIVERYISMIMAEMKDTLGFSAALKVDFNPLPGRYADNTALQRFVANTRPVTVAHVALQENTSPYVRTRLMDMIFSALKPTLGDKLLFDHENAVQFGTDPNQIHFFVEGSPAVLIKKIGEKDTRGYERLAAARDALATEHAATP